MYGKAVMRINAPTNNWSRNIFQKGGNGNIRRLSRKVGVGILLKQEFFFSHSKRTKSSEELVRTVNKR